LNDRKFSRAPRPGPSARPKVNRQFQVVEVFKNTYIQERRVLERFRGGPAVAVYKPSPSLDGATVTESPEDKPRKNAWQQAYNKIKASQNFTDPVQYLRILFRVLRGSSLAIPFVNQLATPTLLEMVNNHFTNRNRELRVEFLAESQRARTAILIAQKGSGQSLSRAVYSAIVDSRLELSALFKYCLAVSTSEHCEKHNIDNSSCKRLDDLAKQHEFLAALDYVTFSDLYDQVWGNTIPENFRVVAKKLLESGDADSQ
jgi:hypothetical protein